MKDQPRGLPTATPPVPKEKEGLVKYELLNLSYGI